MTLNIQGNFSSSRTQFVVGSNGAAPSGAFTITSSERVTYLGDDLVGTVGGATPGSISVDGETSELTFEPDGSIRAVVGRGSTGTVAVGTGATLALQPERGNASLQVGGTAAGSLDLTGAGILDIDAGDFDGRLSLTANGTATLTEGARVFVSGITASFDMTSGGTLALDGKAQLQVLGEDRDGASIAIGGGGAPASVALEGFSLLYTAGTTTVGRSGAVVLDGASALRASEARVEAGGTILVEGRGGFVVIENEAGALSVEDGASVRVERDAQFAVQGDATFEAGSALTMSLGAFPAREIVRADGGTITFDADAAIRIIGDGPIAAGERAVLAATCNGGAVEFDDGFSAADLTVAGAAASHGFALTLDADDTLAYHALNGSDGRGAAFLDLATLPGAPAGANGRGAFFTQFSGEPDVGEGTIGRTRMLAANVTGVGGTAGGDLVSVGGTGPVNVFGRGGDDFIGSTSGGVIAGGTGNDFLSAYGGAEVLNGGAGFDTVLFVAPDFDTGPGITLDLLAPRLNTGVAAGDRLVGIESVVGTARPDVIRGTNGDDFLFGSNPVTTMGVLFPGDRDILNGRGGDDVLAGGDGNDVLIGGAGADALRGGFGFDAANYVGARTGVVADLVLGGRAGDSRGDTYEAVEIVVGSRHADVLRGQETGDVLVGGAGDDVLSGRAGTDRLVGGVGDDVLFGGRGGDVLFGGAGADTFAYTDGDLGDVPRPPSGPRSGASESVNAVAARPRDLIADFGSGDLIDLSRIDADASRAGDQAFVLDAGGAFEQGEVRVSVLAGGVVRVEANVDADAAPELDLFVRAPTLGADDFIL